MVRRVIGRAEKQDRHCRRKPASMSIMSIMSSCSPYPAGGPLDPLPLGGRELPLPPDGPELPLPLGGPELPLGGPELPLGGPELARWADQSYRYPVVVGFAIHQQLAVPPGACTKCLFQTLGRTAQALCCRHDSADGSENQDRSNAETANPELGKSSVFVSVKDHFLRLFDVGVFCNAIADELLFSLVQSDYPHLRGTSS